MPEELTRYVPIHEATRLAGRSPATLKAWAKSGLVQATCPWNKLWLFDRADLERVISERVRLGT